jgi:hypothetical protein
MEETDQNLPSQQDLQIVKLNLEIESLRKRNRWEPYPQFLPLATAIVACLGLAIGFYEFNISQAGQREEEQEATAADQRIRFQHEVRADGEELLRFVQDEKETPAKVAFLFGLLNATLESGTGDGSLSEEYARPLTESLVGLITEDSGFEKSPRNIVFASRALDNWDDYKKYLGESENAWQFNQILYEHTRAIRYLRDTTKPPGYLQSLFYNSDTCDIDHQKFENVKGEEARYQRFVDVWESFKDHVQFAEKVIQTANSEGKPVPDIELRENIKGFEEALCNAKIAPTILGKYFSGAKCEL